MSVGEHFYVTESVVEEELLKHARRAARDGRTVYIHKHRQAETCGEECYRLILEEVT